MPVAKANHYDLIIVGGGLVGASLALALRHCKLRIALIDARLPSADDARLFALNVSSITLLNHLEVWSKISAHASPIHAVHVSHRGHFGALNLRAEEAGLTTLGQVVPARYLEAAMHEAVMALETLTVIRPARVVALGSDTTLTIEKDDVTITLTAPLVIGADGTESTLRDLLHIPTETVDYHQTAIVTQFQLSRPHHEVAYERFCEGGALAMLPLPHQQCASILSVDSQEAKALLALNDEAYLAHCERLIGHRLGRLLTIAPRHAYPLRMKRAKQSVSSHVFLLGNALHTLHPIAAQGLNLALYEVACLAEGIQSRCETGEVITATDLQKMSQQTEHQQWVSTTVSDKLARLFLKPQPGLALLAGFSMAGLDCLPQLKKRFMTMMIGRSGMPPALLVSNQE